MEENIMRVNLKIWRQADARSKGEFVTYNNCRDYARYLIS